MGSLGIRDDNLIREILNCGKKQKFYGPSFGNLNEDLDSDLLFNKDLRNLKWSIGKLEGKIDLKMRRINKLKVRIFLIEMFIGLERN